MRKFTAILQTNKEPKDTNALWYHKGTLKYYGNNGWEIFNEIHPEDIPINIDSIPEVKNLKDTLDYLAKQAKDYRVVQTTQELEEITHEFPGSVTDGTRAYVTDTKDSYVYNLANDVWMRDDSNRFTEFKILAKTLKVVNYDSHENTIDFDTDVSNIASEKFFIAYEDQDYKATSIEDLSYCELIPLDGKKVGVMSIFGNGAIPYNGMTAYLIYTDKDDMYQASIPIISLNPDLLEEGIYEVVLRYYKFKNGRIPDLKLELDLLNTLYDLRTTLDTATTNITKLSNKMTNLNSKIDSIDYLYPVSYGVRITGQNVVSRIGNTEFNNTLPIQNGMKGCIAKIKDGKAEIQYYLNQDDFRWYDTEYVLNTTEDMDYTIIDESKGTFTVTLHTDLTSDDTFNPNRIKGAWVHSLNKESSGGYTCECLITDIDTSTNKITLQPKKVYTLETLKAEMNDEFYLGSVFNGYDGEVMIEVPSFYLKGFKIDNNTYDVRISPYFIDSSWEHQPKILVSAFCNTVLNEVPEDMGYLSTLPVGAAISVVNTGTYCRGGNNDSTYDSNLETYPFSTNLGKPRTKLSRAEMRKSARLGGKEVMSYLEYKRIFHWLWVIEYADLNTANTSNLGTGLSTISTSELNDSPQSFPIYPNGYILSHPSVFSAKNKDYYYTSFKISGYGSNTSLYLTNLTCTLKHSSGGYSYNIHPIIWHGFENPFGNVLLNVDGIVLDGTDNRSKMKVYITDNPELYGESPKGMTLIKTLSTSSIQSYDLIGKIINNTSADILPNTGNINNGYHWYNGAPNSTAMRTVLFGACATQGSYFSYLRNFYSNSDIRRANIEIGFRTVFVLDK